MAFRSYRPECYARIYNYLKGWVFRTARGIERQAQQNAPRATGEMAKSITSTIAFPVSVVSANVPYARFVEGYPVTTKRHFVGWYNKPLLEAWARRRGFKTRKVDGSVSHWGLWVWGYATHFFDNAVKAIRIKAMAELRAARL